MFDRRFLQTRLGHAAMASVAAMALFVALSAQIQATPAFAASGAVATVELA
ncbi:hypothetical protein N0B51_11160 [Tsuneonella sp. YG55]|uniref:Uncharacterized protein n=1 Tax=Tsuneonella litorea TaxID=2976475 RepID=A0A9X2W2H6_9SPHN|nr:hypothetical protein [Tsuneonella litorea]MCT2559537.1 hypothetical protein [Tsuneonella litorea]